MQKDFLKAFMTYWLKIVSLFKFFWIFSRQSEKRFLNTHFFPYVCECKCCMCMRPYTMPSCSPPFRKQSLQAIHFSRFLQEEFAHWHGFASRIENCLCPCDVFDKAMSTHLDWWNDERNSQINGGSRNTVAPYLTGDIRQKQGLSWLLVIVVPDCSGCRMPKVTLPVFCARCGTLKSNLKNVSALWNSVDSLLHPYIRSFGIWALSLARDACPVQILSNSCSFLTSGKSWIRHFHTV